MVDCAYLQKPSTQICKDLQSLLQSSLCNYRLKQVIHQTTKDGAASMMLMGLAQRKQQRKAILHLDRTRQQHSIGRLEGSTTGNRTSK